MLAGLLFATHDADDRPDRLAATLLFGGVTLIEYQARLLIAAGASQIVVVVQRMTPELVGALSRVGRRGIAVDAVRSAVEAVEKVHPLARVLMIADALVTTEGVVAGVAGEGGDVLMVVPEADAGADYERVGGHMAWAGVARLEPGRLAEVAALPRDYDMQSTLIRVAAQARAAHVRLPADALRGGHGFERRASALERRSRQVLVATVASRRGWFDRFVLAPVARLTLPQLVDRAAPTAAVAAVGGVIAAGGLIALIGGYIAAGLMAVLVAVMILALGAVLADLRDEAASARWQRLAAAILPAPAVLLVGRAITQRSSDGAALVTAMALVAFAGLTERATRPGGRRAWWGSPAGYLLIVTLAAQVGTPALGLGAAAVYAAITLGAVVERWRQQP